MTAALFQSRRRIWKPGYGQMATETAPKRFWMNERGRFMSIGWRLSA